MWHILGQKPFCARLEMALCLTKKAKEGRCLINEHTMALRLGMARLRRAPLSTREASGVSVGG